MKCGCACAFIVLYEDVTWPLVAGAALVIGGVYLTNRSVGGVNSGEVE